MRGMAAPGTSLSKFVVIFVVLGTLKDNQEYVMIRC